MSGDDYREIAWDEQTQAHFAKSDRLNVEITSVVKTARYGSYSDSRSLSFSPNGEEDYEVHGVITWPKLILVEIGFGNDQNSFGGWFYNVYNKPTSPSGVGIPCIAYCSALIAVGYLIRRFR